MNTHTLNKHKKKWNIKNKTKGKLLSRYGKPVLRHKKAVAVFFVVSNFLVCPHCSNIKKVRQKSSSTHFVMFH